MAEMVRVPDLVGQPVDIAQEKAAEVGLLLASGDPDGPGLRSRTWPGLFWVTAQDPAAGASLERGIQVRIEFVEDGHGEAGIPVPAS